MKSSLILGLGVLIFCSLTGASFASLTAYWSFDADFTNIQGNASLDGSPVGTASITNTPGEFEVGGGALRIDNAPDATDYVDIPGNVLLGTPGSIVNTVVAWYRYDDISLDGSDERNFVWETAPSSWPLSFGIRDDGFDKKAQWFTDSPSTGGSLTNMPAVNDGLWHHAAIVIDEANDLLMYYHDGYFWDAAYITDLTLNLAGATSFHIGNHRAGDGGRNWDGYIDEVAVFNQLLTDTEIQGLYEKTLDILDITSTELTFTINRDSREVAITNNSGNPIELDGYSISSDIGSFNESAWVPITENGDADSGGSVDSVNTWDVDADSAFHLAESSRGASGAMIADGQTVQLGSLWFPNPTEDIQFTYFSDGQEVTTGGIIYSGNNAAPFALGDLDFDGDIGPGDWTAFLVGHGGDFGTLSLAEAYGLGDLDGDLDNDMFDFLAFESLYDAANGPGALGALMAGVPEPATLAIAWMFVIAVCCWSGLRRKRTPSSQSTCVRTTGILGLVILVALVSSPGRADLVASWTFDADFSASTGGLLFDFTPYNGATAGDAGGKFGNAATFERVNQEYAFTSGDVLLPGPGQDHSYSAWYRLDVADIVGGDRYFVLETTAGDSPSNTTAWSASYGLRDLGAGDVGQVFTATAAGTSADASFDAVGNQVWHNIIVTYDADGGFVEPGLHTYYLDGVEIGSFENSDPLVTVGGLVIGGHRAGTGRNWDGQIDDLGFFDHILTADEIALLQNQSVQELATDSDELTLTVDRGTGQVTLNNTGNIAVTFNSYQMDSAGGSLNPTDGTGWNSLDDQNHDAIGSGVGESWDEGGSVSAQRLIESFLLGSTELAPDASLSLGKAYDTSVDAQDLSFRFHSVDRGPFAGLVEYIMATTNADFDEDGDVDGHDFLAWQRGFGITGTATLGDGDANGDQTVDAADLAVWRDQFGAGSGASGSAAVPEPAAWLVMLVLWIAISLVCRRSRR